MKCSRSVLLFALGASGVALSPAASAQSVADSWQFQAIAYGYFPDIGGKTTFPAGAGSSIAVSNDAILDSLNFTFMGTFEARKGRWGVFTDFIYLDVSGARNGYTGFEVGQNAIPAGASSNVDLRIKATLWTLAGEYTAIDTPSTVLNVLAGARLLDLEEKLSYSLTADVGPITGPGRSGQTTVDQSYWDAVIGVKGRLSFGAHHEWSIPYYTDVGTGQSDLTWQVFGGVGYRFASWGSVIGGWRYMDYKFKSGSKVEELSLNGPMIGVAFNW